MTREEFISNVDASQKAFRRFLTGICGGDTQLADDIAQESYIKAYMARGTLRDPSKFKSWIYRIGVNEYLNSRRSLHTPASEAIDKVDEAATDDSFRYQHLYLALNQLSDRERSAIILFYMEGYSVAEIAKIIDATESAVKQYLHRGRLRLSLLIKK